MFVFRSFTLVHCITAASGPGAVAPLVDTAAVSAGSTTSLSTVIFACVVSAVVACFAAVAVMLTIRHFRNKRVMKQTERKFSNMQGRLSHTSNLGFEGDEPRDASSYDAESLSNVDLE